MKFKFKPGFTLAEVLIGILVLAIIIAIALPSITKKRKVIEEVKEHGKWACKYIGNYLYQVELENMDDPLPDDTKSFNVSHINIKNNPFYNKKIWNRTDNCKIPDFPKDTQNMYVEVYGGGGGGNFAKVTPWVPKDRVWSSIPSGGVVIPFDSPHYRLYFCRDNSGAEQYWEDSIGSVISSINRSKCNNDSGNSVDHKINCRAGTQCDVADVNFAAGTITYSGKKASASVSPFACKMADETKATCVPRGTCGSIAVSMDTEQLRPPDVCQGECWRKDGSAPVSCPAGKCAGGNDLFYKPFLNLYDSLAKLMLMQPAYAAPTPQECGNQNKDWCAPCAMYTCRGANNIKALIAPAPPCRFGAEEVYKVGTGSDATCNVENLKQEDYIAAPGKYHDEIRCFAPSNRNLCSQLFGIQYAYGARGVRASCVHGVFEFKEGDIVTVVETKGQTHYCGSLSKDGVAYTEKIYYGAGDYREMTQSSPHNCAKTPNKKCTTLSARAYDNTDRNLTGSTKTWAEYGGHECVAADDGNTWTYYVKRGNNTYNLVKLTGGGAGRITSLFSNAAGQNGKTSVTPHDPWNHWGSVFSPLKGSFSEPVSSSTNYDTIAVSIDQFEYYNGCPGGTGKIASGMFATSISNQENSYNFNIGKGGLPVRKVNGELFDAEPGADTTFSYLVGAGGVGASRDCFSQTPAGIAQIQGVAQGNSYVKCGNAECRIISWGGNGGKIEPKETIRDTVHFPNREDDINPVVNINGRTVTRWIEKPPEAGQGGMIVITW